MCTKNGFHRIFSREIWCRNNFSKKSRIGRSNSPWEVLKYFLPHNMVDNSDSKADFKFGFLAIDYPYFDTKTTFLAFIVEEIEAKWVLCKSAWNLHKICIILYTFTQNSFCFYLFDYRSYKSGFGVKIGVINSEESEFEGRFWIRVTSYAVWEKDLYTSQELFDLPEA